MSTPAQTASTAPPTRRTPSDVFASLLPGHLERCAWSRERIAEHRRTALHETLAHAVARSPFHARRLAGIDLERIDPDDLSALPVMTKDEMMASFDEVVCDPRLRLDAIERHLATIATEPKLLHDEFLVLASGGSSGVRGTFVYDLEAAAHYLLGCARTSVARMFASGGPAQGAASSAMIAATSGVHATRALVHLFGSGLLNVTSIPATIPLADIVRRLQELQPQSLQGYPTVVAQIADEQVAGRLRISPLTVTTSSEPLTDDLRMRIEAGFGVPVSDMFGASEGLMGASEPGTPGIVMPADQVILELVDDDNRPVPPGIESSKVLLTTLYNRTQPLVRYELTDRMTLCRGDSADGHPRVTVSGRSDDLLDYGGVLVHPHAIRSVFVNCASVREYQIRQTRRGVDVVVVASAGHEVDTRAVVERLRAALATAGLQDPDVEVHVVADLARHPQTGKVRRIVPLS